MRAVLLVGALFGGARAFVPTGHGAPAARAVLNGDVASVAVEAPAVREQQPSQGLSAASGVAAALLLGAAWRSRPARGARRATTVVEVKTSPVAFAGATLPKMVEVPAEEDLVARRSLKSCYKLYFHRVIPYKDRAKKNIRNRAYNIYHKNEYKRQFRTALKKVKEIQFSDSPPTSKAEVMTEMTPYMDTACLTIDEVCIQGILHRNTAARRKDRLCRAVLRGLVEMKLEEKPEDPFKPAFETIGYTMPKSFKTREPRPWQLPGWKSPWMLKKEFTKWQKQRAAK